MEIENANVNPEWEAIDQLSWSHYGQEVIRLHAGTMKDPTELLEYLSAPTRDDMFRHRLALAANCLVELRFDPEQERATDLRLRACMDRIANEVVDLWWKHALQGTATCVSHLEGALRALVEIKAVYKGKTITEWLRLRVDEPIDISEQCAAAYTLGVLGESAGASREVLETLVTAVLDRPSDPPLYPVVFTALQEMGRQLLDDESLRAGLLDIFKAHHQSPQNHQNPKDKRRLEIATLILARSLYKAGWNRDLVDHLMQYFEQPCPAYLRVRARQVLVRANQTILTHDGVLDTLFELLSSNDDKARLDALALLAQFGTFPNTPENIHNLRQIIENLLKLLDTQSESELQGQLLTAFRNMGENADSESMTAALMHVALKHNNSGFSRIAAQTLGKLGRQFTLTSEQLDSMQRQIFNEKESADRIRAIYLFSQLAERFPNRSAVCERLIKILKQKSSPPAVRAIIAEAFAVMEPGICAPQVKEALLFMVQDDDPRFREQTIYALIRMEGPTDRDILAALFALVRNTAESYRPAVEAIGAIGKQMCKDQNRETRHILAEIKQYFTDVLNQVDQPELCMRAAQALGDLGRFIPDDKMIYGLLNLSNAGNVADVQIKVRAVEALGKIGQCAAEHPLILFTLVTTLNNANQPELREAAAAALDNLMKNGIRLFFICSTVNRLAGLVHPLRRI